MSNNTEPFAYLSASNSPDWLRSFKGCEHYSDEEAIQVIEALNILAGIFLKAKEEKTLLIDNQCIVSLKSINHSNKKVA